jgi:hypothetical protein
MDEREFSSHATWGFSQARSLAAFDKSKRKVELPGYTETALLSDSDFGTLMR